MRGLPGRGSGVLCRMHTTLGKISGGATPILRVGGGRRPTCSGDDDDSSRDSPGRGAVHEAGHDDLVGAGLRVVVTESPVGGGGNTRRSDTVLRDRVGAAPAVTEQHPVAQRADRVEGSQVQIEIDGGTRRDSPWRDFQADPETDVAHYDRCGCTAVHSAHDRGPCARGSGERGSCRDQRATGEQDRTRGEGEAAGLLGPSQSSRHRLTASVVPGTPELPALRPGRWIPDLDGYLATGPTRLHGIKLRQRCRPVIAALTAPVPRLVARRPTPMMDVITAVLSALTDPAGTPTSKCRCAFRFRAAPRRDPGGGFLIENRTAARRDPHESRKQTPREPLWPRIDRGVNWKPHAASLRSTCHRTHSGTEAEAPDQRTRRQASTTSGSKRLPRWVVISSTAASMPGISGKGAGVHRLRSSITAKAQPPGPTQAAGCCWVMQCTLPPPSAISRPGTVTTLRSGKTSSSRAVAEAS